MLLYIDKVFSEMLVTETAALPFLTSEQRPNAWSDAYVVYNSFPACPHLWMNLLDKFLVGHELNFLSRKVCAHLIHSSGLTHSLTTKNNKKKFTNLTHKLCHKIKLDTNAGKKLS